MSAISVSGGSSGVKDYASKAAVNRTPKYGGLYGQPAQLITIAGVPYQWTGTAIQTLAAGATDAAPAAPPAAPTISAAPGSGQNVLTLSALTATSRTVTRTVDGITTALSVGSATSYTDSGLTNGILVSYAAYDTNATGDSPTATASATPTAAPATATVNSLSTRAMMPFQLSAGTSAYQEAATRVRVHATRQTTAPQFEWVNWFANSGDQPGVNDVYLTAALEVLTQTNAPTIYPLTFGGAVAGTMAANASLKSDPLTGVTLPAGATLFVRSHTSVVSVGQKFPQSHYPYALRDEGTFGPAQVMTVDVAGAGLGATSIPLTAATTVPIGAGVPLIFGTTQVITSSAVAAGVTSLPVLATSAALASGVTANHYDPTAATATLTRAPNQTIPYPGPLRMIGQAAGATAITVLLGDSILQGSGDGAMGNNGVQGGVGIEFGWARRVMNGALRGLLNISRGAERASQVTTSTLLRYRLPYIAAGDTVICNYGTNDIQANRTFTQLSADLQAISALVRGRGATFIMCTILPKTTSTDGWLTTTNQTISTGFEATGTSTKDQINAMIRNNTGGFHDGYFETAYRVESAPDSGLWRAGTNTTDGVHPNHNGSILIAEGLSTTERTLMGAPASPYTLGVISQAGRYLLDEASGSTLIDSGLYAAYNGSLNTATRKSGGGLTFTGGASATLSAGLTANLTGRPMGLMLAFNVPASLPSADTVLLSCTGLTISLIGTATSSLTGRVQVSAYNGTTTPVVRTSAALSTGDHAITMFTENGFLEMDLDGIAQGSAASATPIQISGAMALSGFDIHAVIAFADSALAPGREITYKSLKAVLNARSGVVLP